MEKKLCALTLGTYVLEIGKETSLTRTLAIRANALIIASSGARCRRGHLVPYHDAMSNAADLLRGLFVNLITGFDSQHCLHFNDFGEHFLHFNKDIVNSCRNQPKLFSLVCSLLLYGNT